MQNLNSERIRKKGLNQNKYLTWNKSVRNPIFRWSINRCDNSCFIESGTSAGRWKMRHAKPFTNTREACKHQRDQDGKTVDCKRSLNSPAKKFLSVISVLLSGTSRNTIDNLTQFPYRRNKEIYFRPRHEINFLMWMLTSYHWSLTTISPFRGAVLLIRMNANLNGDAANRRNVKPP